MVRLVLQTASCVGVASTVLLEAGMCCFSFSSTVYKIMYSSTHRITYTTQDLGISGMNCNESTHLYAMLCIMFIKVLVQWGVPISIPSCLFGRTGLTRHDPLLNLRNNYSKAVPGESWNTWYLFGTVGKVLLRRCSLAQTLLSRLMNSHVSGLLHTRGVAYAHCLQHGSDDKTPILIKSYSICNILIHDLSRCIVGMLYNINLAACN